MNNTVIRITNLGKQYRIGARKERYRTFRDSFAALASAQFRRFSHGARQKKSESIIWALRNLDVEIRQGDVVGIIGRNGAGKSTLLKILSRITEPSEGKAEIHGRVGSLLEVGTGFHLELTGRENIFLNGAILGMKRSEIEANFDAIVDFAGVEKFIDTPVKHYSSGMYLRLAFAVAAHLEPEILLVDEVLAVGDAAFQKKCIGKMGDVAAQGRTILFVSHNLGAVRELCTTAIVLANGSLDFCGPVVDGLARYSRNLLNNEEGNSGHYGWGFVGVNGNRDGCAVQINPDDEIVIESRLELKGDCVTGYAFALLEDSMGDIIVHLRMDPFERSGAVMRTGGYCFSANLPSLWLAPGVYTLYMKFRGDNQNGEQERYVSERVIIEVTGSLAGVRNAVLAPSFQWAVRPFGKGQSVTR